MIHVNTDMDELTAHGDLGHVVPGSCHAFLDLMLERAADSSSRALQAGQAQRGANGWRKIKAGAAALRRRELQPSGSADPSRQRRSRHCARRFRATASCWSIPARTAPSPATIGRAYEPRTLHLGHQSRTDGLGDPGRHRRAVRAARTGASRSSPATAACRCTASKCRPRRATDCRSIYVVLNNGALGNVWLRARQYGALPAELTSIPDHDWAGFARARSGRKDSPCATRQNSRTPIAQALAAGTTVLIDVKADKDCVTPVYDFSAGARAWSYHE